MNDFLKKLTESLDSGIPNEAIVAGFDEIITKADAIGSNPSRLEEVEQKQLKAQDSRKPLTAEEIKELEFVAMKQQQKIDEFDFNAKLSAALVNVDLAIEKLSMKIQDFMYISERLRDDSISVADKKELVKNVLKEINGIEAPIAKAEKFCIGNDDVIYGEDKTIYGKVGE